MKFLNNSEVINIPSLTIEQVDALSLETAKLYQSIFALEPWNEVGLSNSGEILSLSQVSDNFTPFYYVQDVANRIKEVIQNPQNIFIASISNQAYPINQDLLSKVTPVSTEFPESLSGLQLNEKQVFVTGFIWATQKSTEEILQIKGGFCEPCAREYVSLNNLQKNAIFIEELGVARYFQRGNIGRQLKNLIQQELDQRQQTVFTNTSTSSGAYKLFTEMGAQVIAGPGVNGRDGYVLFKKQY